MHTYIPYHTYIHYKVIKIAKELQLKKTIVKKNKFKIVYKSIYVQKQPFRGVLQERHCTNKKDPQENNRAEARCQQSSFATVLKSHPCTDAPLRI